MVAIRGPGWGLAPCLVDLIYECDQLAPNRSRVSDGSIGDLAHSARTSDHNPDDGWVCAVDVTDDKAGGCDADLLARHIIARRDVRVKYVIWNRTIAKSYASNGFRAWEPQPYTGTNSHDKHTHVSVHNTSEARNDLSPWWPQEEPAPAPTPVITADTEGEPMVIRRKSNPKQAILLVNDKRTGTGTKAYYSADGGISTTPDNHVSVDDDVWSAFVKDLKTAGVLADETD